MVTTLAWAVIGGAVIGVLARLVIPGRQPVSWWASIVVGVAAAFVGTGIAQVFGFRDTPGIDWKKHVLQLGLAVIGILLLTGINRRRHPAGRR
ncbi:membrane protein [Actinocatenispora thailandica]|uniref:Membrane protein n=1 Tax=Actinocatenispora thailandica TaxID=227318 RepID=A0A7R7DVR0_9ACTN|nr:GlsB/YeaQ/YmgE family stress response membrane protein [Actinocatenispora thailandica]BCJ38772.1 membrane protein [Actinocatenispora thailandica]